MPHRHVVKTGDCLESIAFAYGLFPDSVWEHHDNETLRQTREPHQLRPGDIIVIPDAQSRWVDVATDATHRFRRHGVPAKLLLVLRSAGEPRAGVDYTLVVGDKRLHGTTNGSGEVEEWIPPDAPSAVLEISDVERYELELGGLIPHDDDEGVRARLHNLGYAAGGDDDDENDENDNDDNDDDNDDDENDDDQALTRAVAAFQRDQGIQPANGIIDDRTRAKLRTVHGC